MKKITDRFRNRPCERGFIIALTLMLAACQDAPTAYRPTPLAFQAGVISLAVARIEVIDHYQAPMRRPNVEQDFPVSPAHAVKNWVGNRLKATGNSGVLEVVINDASVTEIPLPKTPGVKGLFTDDQDARYDATLSVTYRLTNGITGVADSKGEVNITRSRSIHEKATVNERAAMYQQMTQALIQDFDRESQARLHQYFLHVVR